MESVVTVWSMGTDAFARVWQQAFERQFGRPGTPGRAIDLHGHRIECLEWDVPSRRAGLDIHDWVVELSHQPAGGDTGLLVLAAWAKDAPPSNDSHSDFWCASLVRVDGQQNILSPGYTQTWGLVQGVRMAKEHQSVAVQAITDRLLEDHAFWKKWKAVCAQDRLELALPSVESAPPRSPRI